MQANGAHKERVLFLLDEVILFGTMQTLETARDEGRKYGVMLMMVYQSIGQLERHFGRDGKAAWFESASFIAFAARERSPVGQRGLGALRPDDDRGRGLVTVRRPED